VLAFTLFDISTLRPGMIYELVLSKSSSAEGAINAVSRAEPDGRGSTKGITSPTGAAATSSSAAGSADGNDENTILGVIEAIRLEDDDGDPLTEDETVGVIIEDRDADADLLALDDDVDEAVRLALTLVVTVADTDAPAVKDADDDTVAEGVIVAATLLDAVLVNVAATLVLTEDVIVGAEEGEELAEDVGAAVVEAVPVGVSDEVAVVLAV
jgi:hypothetical protein